MKPKLIKELYKYNDLSYFSRYDGKMKLSSVIKNDQIRFYYIWSFQEFNLTDDRIDRLIEIFKLNLYD